MRYPKPALLGVACAKSGASSLADLFEQTIGIGSMDIQTVPDHSGPRCHCRKFHIIASKQ
jgi:hypothetical protein